MGEARWKRWAIWSGWGALSLFALAFIVVLAEQFASGFYYFDGRNALEGLGIFVVELLGFFLFYLALPAVGGLVVLIALVWIAAYVSVRWQEHRAGRQG